MLELTPRQQAVLLSNPWFAELAAEIRDDVFARVRRRELAQGQYLFRRGDAYEGFYGVLDGSVRISGVTRGGQEAILTFYEPGAWFGEISAFDGLPRTHDAQAHKPTTLLWLQPADFEALLDRHPALPRLFLRLECARLRLVAGAFEEFSTQSFEARLASRLLALAEGFGASNSHGVRIELHLSQETLAQLVGATRQRINQVLQDWARDGLVEQHRGKLTVLDEARLRRVAQG
ncbi:Crp/Fnr family transcriptional regulator [Variovorax sp. YR216]|uniref:Crp/Fnr family transcriptional regulator n=1 Tax=Variovorax sp. YR216 TaxID=1882828 RepID=UPI000896211D|nr:Crp/Fnr family transcriptional regulator [Variovorax sp. YR216]SEB19020.1 transcriptional regulator, Crp/Fnr family [Variovorax sp. YR216]